MPSTAFSCELSCSRNPHNHVLELFYRSIRNVPAHSPHEIAVDIPSPNIHRTHRSPIRFTARRVPVQVTADFGNLYEVNINTCTPLFKLLHCSRTPRVVFHHSQENILLMKRLLLLCTNAPQFLCPVRSSHQPPTTTPPGASLDPPLAGRTTSLTQQSCNRLLLTKRAKFTILLW